MSFKKKIDMILEAKKLERLTKNKIEKLIGVDGTIYKAYDDDREPADLEIVRNLIGKLGIRQQWWDKDWETGNIDIFNTSVQMASDNKEKAPIEVYRDLVEANSEYRLVPKTILEGKYVIVLEAEIGKTETALWAAMKTKDDYIQTLKEEIAEIRSRTPAKKAK